MWWWEWERRMRLGVGLDWLDGWRQSYEIVISFQSIAVIVCARAAPPSPNTPHARRASTLSSNPQTHSPGWNDDDGSARRDHDGGRGANAETRPTRAQQATRAQAATSRTPPRALGLTLLRWRAGRGAAAAVDEAVEAGAAAAAPTTINHPRLLVCRSGTLASAACVGERAGVCGRRLAPPPVGCVRVQVKVMMNESGRRRGDLIDLRTRPSRAPSTQGGAKAPHPNPHTRPRDRSVAACPRPG